MPLPDWELNLGLDALGLSDADKATVEAAIPVAAAVVNHINANKSLIATLEADGKLLWPAISILINAINAKNGGSS